MIRQYMARPEIFIPEKESVKGRIPTVRRLCEEYKGKRLQEKA